MNPQADILIVTVTKVESQAVMKVFREATGKASKPESIGDRTYHDLGQIEDVRVFMALSQMGSGGLGGTQEAVRKGIEALKPQAVIMVGIAFGVNEEKQTIGDILVSQQLWLYDLQRVGTDKDSKLTIIPRGDKPHASTWLFDRFQSADLYWEESKCKVRFGVVMSGDKLVDNFDFREQLKQLESEAIGGEMEGTGLYVSSHDKKVDWILVKAICDWGDGHKSQDKDVRQQTAAHNAAAFVLHALQQAPLKREAVNASPDQSANHFVNIADNHNDASTNAQSTGSGAVAQGDSRAVGQQGLMAEQVNSSTINYGTIIQTKESASSTGREIKGESKNMLPTQPYFFGRAKELDIIKSALSPESRTWGALIDGPGGIGKTALAIKAAHDAPAELFERKIFITAKVRELNADGEAKLTDFTRPTYLAMLDELGKELGTDNLEKLAPDERPNELRLALAGQKALIIFDNLETLPEEERTRLFQFLARLPEGNKAIGTSRRGRRDIDARSVRLDRLERDEALQLIAELAAKYPRLDRALLKEREDLYEITQGNPLFIRWIAGQLGRAGSQCRTIAEAIAFIDKAPKGNDPLEYIFGDLLETFTTDETKVLAALTYFNLPAKLKWIADMTNLSERAAETALEDLTDRSILISNLESLTFFLPPLTAKFIRTRRPEVVAQTGDALTDRAYAIALQYGGYDNYEGFRTLNVEWNFVFAALQRLLMGDNDRLRIICDQLTFFLDFTGKWDDLIWFHEQAEARARTDDDKENAGWYAYNAGFTYYLRHQPAEVLACASRAAEHWQDSTPLNKTWAIQLRGLGHKLNKDYPAAIAAFRESLEVRRSISHESSSVAIALNSLASAELNNKDYSAAKRDYREALRIAKINKDNEGTAIYTGNLAALALAREQWAEAEALARKALSLAEKVGRQELIASDSYRIAQALLKQNKNIDEALSLSRHAVEIFMRLRHHDLAKAQKTLVEIEQAQNDE